MMDINLSKVYKRLRNKNPTGIPYDEAVQLFLSMFCTLDFLPDEIRNCVLGRKELVEIFSTLELENLIINSPGRLNDRVDRQACCSRWNELIDNLLAGKIQLHPDSTSKASKYF